MMVLLVSWMDSRDPFPRKRSRRIYWPRQRSFQRSRPLRVTQQRIWRQTTIEITRREQQIDSTVINISLSSTRPWEALKTRLMKVYSQKWTFTFPCILRQCLILHRLQPTPLFKITRSILPRIRPVWPIKLLSRSNFPQQLTECRLLTTRNTWVITTKWSSTHKTYTGWFTKVSMV